MPSLRKPSDGAHSVWTTETIEACTGPVEAQCLEGGIVAWHPVPWTPLPEGAQYTITHRPSGLCLVNTRTQAQAKALCLSLSQVPGLGKPSPDSQTLQKAWAIMSDAEVGVTRRPPKPKTPLLTPIYPPGQPVSPGLQLLDRKLADRLTAAMAGHSVDREEFGQLVRQTTELAWREEIIMRVVPRYALSEDIPSAATVTVAGYPVTTASFRSLYDELVACGERLRVGSEKLLALWEDGERDGWTEQQVERFRRLDQRYLSVVHLAWRRWGVAAVIFDQLPVAYQQAVRTKLGDIGSRERGWHALGLVTFYRHRDLIHRACVVRREFRRRDDAMEL